MADHSMSDQCSNCGFVFAGIRNYCPRCGQKNKQLTAPLKYLLEEVLESTLHLDSKSFRTISSLLIRPGHLSVEFNSGRRAKYVAPIRIYVLLSFIFFLLFGLLTGGPSADVDEGQASPKKGLGLSFTIRQISSRELVGLSKEQVDALMVKRGVPATIGYKFVFHQMHKVANRSASAAEFSHLLIKNISYMMFILMPVFGAWIYVFHWRKQKYFIESLVTSIHFHSYLFLMLTILMLISVPIKNEIPLLAMPVLGAVYLYLMFRRVFQQSVWLILLKMICIGLLYILSFAFLIICTALISLITV
jgi:hypothetical protein